MVHNAQFWLNIVHEYLNEKEPMSKLCKKYSVDCGKIKYRVNLYLLYGDKPFTDEQENRVWN